ncbi:dicarboxylate/amino acid:cation symporter [Bifidobacterium bifidum]|uniref:L-cystine uptake protein TcyP n=2 Tax=Bifidobacterium bifidum TaxID=1681 RepID=A0A7J5TND2_BIFBI|nr:dicarboxylate/amino acid:cation symporter [Bifidobacterium bifidum]KAB5603267.1 dicarboxylate/amino acid:cation symporter [Bifidobacterium bifidum]KAB5604606.1 dicarboxylate/amino acid:cation symporter [Bifidobacterium bifidum]KAB7467679.1 dicarboxylate/amino acid:cation symporter [Bifidobacterium bifidum]KAB7470179.1 dicarboxylate/amino acid:cation symporter [Bifidobacterium bifidum]KAB7471172.1 dicarboxylate/amino acid:cation symporter [Bifidobacterium bifidum]
MGALSNIDPTAVAVWASTVVLFALIAVLRAVFKLNFSLLTVLALGLGIALSLVFDGQVDSLNLLGNIYINLITALVAPLIFVSIISSITYVGSLKKLRSIGLRSVGWLLLTNLIAIVMTLGVAIPLHIGSGVKLVDDESTAGFLTSQTAPLDQVILNFFPKNIVGDLSGNRVVPIIITATVLAIAIVSVGRQKDVSIVKRFFEQTKDVIYKAVGYVVELTPYAVVVLGATSTAATTSKADALLALLSILVLGFVLNIIQAFVVNGLLLKFVAHVPPLTFFKAVLPAQTTQSSVATLPLSIRQLGTVGVGADVANFTTPIGTTIGMPGCAGVWPMLSAVFTINALGLGYSPVSYVALAVIGLLSSIGTAGVPGTAIVTATTVFTAVGLPVQLLVPLVPVSNIVGMPSTMANVSAAVTCAAIVSRQTGEFDEGVLDSARAGRHRHRAGVVVSPAGGAVAAPVVPVAAPLGAVGVAASVVASPVAAGVGAAHKPVQPGFAVTPGLSLTLHQSTLRVQADDDADDAPVPVGACGISAHAATAKAA